MTTDFSDILTSPDIDAVAIVTPVWTHFPLAKLALGRPVLNVTIIAAAARFGVDLEAA